MTYKQWFNAHPEVHHLDKATVEHLYDQYTEALNEAVNSMEEGYTP